jgi:hypothetical protein
MVGKSRWYRLSLSFLLLVVISWLWSSRIDELVYHTFGKSELIALGDATLFSEIRKNIPVNSFVSVTGILGNKAASLTGLRAGSFRFGRYQVRHLLGSKLFIEYSESKYHKKFSPFTQVSVKGRLVAFGPGSELEKVRTFFKEYYHQPVDDNAMLIVVDEIPRSEFIYGLFFLLSIALLLLSFYFSIKAFRDARKKTRH